MTFEILMLCILAFTAGFIDSMVGGGGLIQLPALFIFMSDYPTAVLLGTNKLVSMTGTLAANIQYLRRVKVDWQTTLPVGVTAFAFSMIGARVVSVVNPDILRPLIVFLLVGMAIFTFLRKDFGTIASRRLEGGRVIWVSALVGASIGFYDGFFGPGTGSFLIFAFIGLMGMDFLHASASSKFVNLLTNIAAAIYFVATGQVAYEVVLPMMVCNISGSVLGSRLAILKGSKFVRIFFLLVLVGMIVRFSYDTFFAV